MNSFEAMGEAHLKAAEGQRAFAAALGRWVAATASRWLDRMARHLPESKQTPW